MDRYMVEVEWDNPDGLPRWLGPFKTYAEAEEWGALNVVNGAWSINPLAHPYKAQRFDR